jgi:hypothetical protein
MVTERSKKMKYKEVLKEYNDILLPEDVQKILHTGRNSVYGCLARGDIKSIKVGKKYKIPKLNLLEFIYPDVDFNMEDDE